MSTAVESFLARHVESGTVPGAVVLLAAGDDVEITAAGVAAVDGPAMAADAIVRIQSMTKPVVAVAALRLVEAGRIGLDDGIERWLPELADRRVLRDPVASLEETEPAQRPITLRHLLTSMSGYGMILEPSPLREAMAANGTEARPEPVSLGADEWLARLAELPLAFQPGTGWRYHHSFAVLGILLSRVTGRPLGDHLADDLFAPLGMPDTAFWVPDDKLDRLPAAYRHGADGLVETEPAGGGFHAGPPPYDVSHAELVSTAADLHRFAWTLAAGGEGLVSPGHLAQMTTDQVDRAAKDDASFFPGFWESTGWGFGVGITAHGPHAGRYGWAGGQGTDFYVDPDGTVGILLTQVEMGEAMGPVVQEFQALTRDTPS